ncbi:MAG: prenyltransferase/squalene oxidase repeat-containing protein [Actinomycetales bacterium]
MLLSRWRRPSAVVPVLVVAAVLTALPSTSAQAAAPAPAAAWLEAQLSANSGLLPGPFGGSDVGLTEDAVLALTATGNGEDAPTRAATAKIAASLDQFVTVGVPGIVLAGSVAKSALVADVQGADVTAFGGRDLEHDLRTNMTASGGQAGRFADQGNTPDSSNGFSQAFGLLALARTNGGVPADAVTFLLAQQCPSGGFRLFYDSGDACTDSTQADTDATGLAVQALGAAPSSAAVTTAKGQAVAWLVSHQDPMTGSLSSSGPAAQPNANSTGLGVAALRLGGETAAADQGAAYVAKLQLACGQDTGAVAFDPAARAAAAGQGTIASSDLDQWRRATTQAVLALGVHGYGDMAAVPSGTTLTPTPPAVTPCSGATSPSSSHSSHPSHASHSGSDAPTVLGARASADPALAATGGFNLRLALLGLAALLAGVLFTALATDRRARHR